MEKNYTLYEVLRMIKILNPKLFIKIERQDGEDISIEHAENVLKLVIKQNIVGYTVKSIYMDTKFDFIKLDTESDNRIFSTCPYIIIKI